MIARWVLAMVVVALACSAAGAVDAKVAASLRKGQVAMAKGDVDGAIASFNEAMRLDPKSATAVGSRGDAWNRKGEAGKAIKDFREAIRLHPKFTAAHNNLAWSLATCPKAELRDGKKAVEHAQRACELDGWQSADCLDTLAAAYAEAGDFDNAIATQKTVIQRQVSEPAKNRLALYQQHKAYRDAAPAPRSRKRCLRSSSGVPAAPNGSVTPARPKSDATGFSRSRRGVTGYRSRTSCRGVFSNHHNDATTRPEGVTVKNPPLGTPAVVTGVGLTLACLHDPGCEAQQAEERERKGTRLGHHISAGNLDEAKADV